MAWLKFLSVMTFVIVNAINRPVYKINLTQKGYAQFIEYDVDTPPLREFTICAWIRVYDLIGDQRIFSYVTKGNNRALRLWLDSGGKNIKVSIRGKIPSSVPVNLVKDVWRHICLSYQSDYGAWALYIDSRLAHCEASQSLYGYVLPKGGSVIVGYGTADSGISNGFEGEIFGVNMILISTIEKNFTMRQDPLFQQKPFNKNIVKRVEENKTRYVVLSDLQPEEIHNTFEKAVTTESFVKVQTPFSFIEHSVGGNSESQKSRTPEITDHDHHDIPQSTESDTTNLWGIEKQYQPKTTETPTTPDNIEFPWAVLSEQETPPPPQSTDFYEKSVLINKQRVSQQMTSSPRTTELPEFVAPPVESNHKVYGQWTSSKYAGSVLNYLKSINFKNREASMKRVPKTIPLTKISDSYPYALDFKIQRLRPPAQFSRRNLVERQEIPKRNPQINVKILGDDLRSNIIRNFALTRPKIVEITNRGESKGHKDHRFYRSANYDSAEGFDSFPDISKQPLILSIDNNVKKPRYSDKITITGPKYVSVLPLLQALENKIESQENEHISTPDDGNNNDMYTKSLSRPNKWHNVKSYNNDFTPRRIHINSEEISKEVKKYPALRLKYKHDKNMVEEEDNINIIQGRRLVNEGIHTQPDQINSAYLFKYNHGYLPSHDKKNLRSVSFEKGSKESGAVSNSFDRQVKIGNALNEKHILHGDVNQNKKSFVGGIESIPDLNKEKSEFDDENMPLQRHCNNVELPNHFLYIQQDESIDMTYILSPVRKKNWAIDFIMQNYKKCSLSDSLIEKNSMLLIDWSKTPVRLFGGAYPRTTTDLCGFF